MTSVPTAGRDQLRSVVAGRMVVLVTTQQAAGESILRQLRGLNADRRILVLGPPGLAPVAAAMDAELVAVDLGDEDAADTRRRWETLLEDPPSGLRNLLDARDPDRNALVLVSPWFATADLLGRPVFGASRSGWITPEDKLLGDRLWARAGVPSSPTAVIGR